MYNPITSSQNIHGQIYFNTQHKKWWDEVSKKNIQSQNEQFKPIQRLSQNYLQNLQVPKNGCGCGTN